MDRHLAQVKAADQRLARVTADDPLVQSLLAVKGIGLVTAAVIVEYGRTKEKFFRRFLELPNGIPSHDTFERVFAKLDSDAFADRFGLWMAELCDSARLVHVAIDGKIARRSPQCTFSGCLHLVSAWAVENRLILVLQT